MPNFETGTLNQWEIELIIPEECDFIDKHTFMATSAGQCMVTMQLKGIPAVFKKVEITINP